MPSEERTLRGAPRPDLAIVRRALEGDAGSRAALMKRLECVPRILSAMNARLGGPLDAADLDDLVQETLLAVWRRLPDFEGRAALETWVYRFCHYSLVSFLRRRRQRPANLGESDDEAAAEWPRSPLEFEHVYRALDLLDPDEKAVLRLKQFSGLTFVEIGEQLGLSPNTAKTRYYRGLERLREILEPTWQEGQP